MSWYMNIFYSMEFCGLLKIKSFTKINFDFIFSQEHCHLNVILVLGT